MARVTTTTADAKPISQAVVEAVGAAEGVDPSDLLARLYDSTDPDAFDALYMATTDREDRLEITFTFAGYDVRFENDHRVPSRVQSWPTMRRCWSGRTTAGARQPA